MRFGPRLTITYNLQTTSFMIPPLTLQPLVENAVRYGISKKENGGTITIATSLADKQFSIIVADNGSGFDPSEKKQDGRSHIGIQNVRDRIRTLCNGTLVITSAPGIGTTAVITIPDRGDMPCRSNSLQ